MASRTKNGFRKAAASKNVYWHIAPGQGMKPPSGAFRRNHVFAQKYAAGCQPQQELRATWRARMRASPPADRARTIEGRERAGGVMSLLELLHAGKANIETKGWCQGNEEAVFGKSGRCCAATAIPYVGRDAERAVNLLKRANSLNPNVGIAEWNDAPGRTVEEVLAAYDKAIALAEREGL